MLIRHAVALVALLGVLSSARAEEFRIEDVGSPPNWDMTALKPGTIAFSDGAASASGAANLIAFTEWGRTLPAQKKFLSLYPAYSEPTITKAASADTPAGPVLEKLEMYVAQARFVVNGAPGSFNFARYVSLPFLEKIDPAIKHKLIAATDVSPLTDPQGTGNVNPDREWCRGRDPLICVEFDLQARRQLSARRNTGSTSCATPPRKSPTVSISRADVDTAAADIDQAGLKEFTGLDCRSPACSSRYLLRRSDHEIRQVARRLPGRPSEANRTVVTPIWCWRSRRACSTRRRISRKSRCCATSCRRRS